MGGYELRADVHALRRQVTEAAGKLKWLCGQPMPTSHDAGEILANLALAYRHLEDASARLTRALRAYDGVVYDRDDAGK